MKLSKVAEVTLILASICLILWVGLSWVEIISKNMGPNPTYIPFNFFIILTGGI